VRARTLIPFVVLTNLVVVGSLLLSSRSAERSQGFELEKAKLPEAPPDVEAGGGPNATIRLEPLIVRVNSEDGERFMRAGFAVELQQVKDKDAFMDRMPLIRDSLIRYFMGRKREDLLGGDEMAETKRAVLERVRQMCPRQPIKAVYVTDIVIH
jgi:flagellar basal body-associated protein FliL